MSKDITIELQWSKELALQSSKMYYEHDMRHSRKRYIGWIFVALVQFGIVGALKHDSFGLLYISTFLVLYWYYGRWYIRKSMMEKYFDSLQVTPKKMHFVLREDGFHGANETIPWEDIIKAIEFDEGILLHTTSYTLFFTKDSFKSYEEFQAFIVQMREKGKI